MSESTTRLSNTNPYHLVPWTHFELFGGRMSGEEIGIDDVDVSALVKRIRQLLQKVLAHDVVVELLLTTNIEGETMHFAADLLPFLILYP